MSLCSCVKIFPHRAVSAQRWLDSMAGLIKWRNASFQNVASPQSQFSSSVSHEVNIVQRILCGAQWKWWWVSEWREKSKKAPSLSLLQSLSLTGHPLGIESVTLKENKLAKLRKHPSRVNFGWKKFWPKSPTPVSVFGFIERDQIMFLVLQRYELKCCDRLCDGWLFCVTTCVTGWLSVMTCELCSSSHPPGRPHSLTIVRFKRQTLAYKYRAVQHQMYQRYIPFMATENFRNIEKKKMLESDSKTQ